MSPRPLDPADPTTPAVTLLKALANSSRLRLVNALLDGPLFVEDLADRLELASSTISHHLKVLLRAGLVRSAQVQYYTEYELVDNVLKNDLRSLVAGAADPEADSHGLARARRDVIRELVNPDDGRVRRLPPAMKKRQVLLEALTADLAPGRVYTEGELDAIILRRYPAPDVIRREWLNWRLVAVADAGYTAVEPLTDLRLPAVRGDARTSGATVQAPVRVSGVYWIRNRQTGRVWLGASVNLHAAMNRHRADLTAGRHRCESMQDDWSSLGPDAFELEIVEILDGAGDSTGDLERLAAAWATGMQPMDEHCYNRSVDLD